MYNAISHLIEKNEGKFFVLKESVVPCEATQQSALDFAHKLNLLPPFYLHFGGAGDALLLLASMPLDTQATTVVSVANSIPAMKAFFSAFPTLESVYFLPHPETIPTLPAKVKGSIHYLLRNVTPQLPNCLGRGVTPREDYDTEWNEHLDIFKEYQINRLPTWARQFGGEHLEKPQVVLAPKGSNVFHFRSKRNITNPHYWQPLLATLKNAGIRPFVIGTPDEQVAYPLDDNCIDRRSYSFGDQMNMIASSDLLIGADSWHKTFAALAGVPSIVFKSVTGEDLRRDWKDSSEYLFIDPWENISLIRDMIEFEISFKEWLQTGALLSRHLTSPVAPGLLPVLTSFSPVFWGNDYRKAKKVLIRSSSAIGDSLNLTAVVAEMKRQYPHIDIFISGASIVENIFRHNSHIAGFVEIHSNEELCIEGLSDFTIEYNHILDRLVEYINGIGFMDIFGNIAGIKLQNYDIFYTLELDEALWAAHELKKIADPNSIKLGLQFTSNKDIRRSYPNGLAVIQEIKRSFPDASFVLFGLEPLQEILPDLYDCAVRKVPFRQQMALAAQCDAFITIDSAFFHVGHNLCKKPTLLIVGPTDPLLIGSVDDGFMPVRNTNLECLSCYWRTPCKIECMHHLKPNVIAEAFQKMLADPQTACHDWRQPLEQLDVTLPQEKLYSDVLIRALWDRKQPVRLVLHDPHGVLPGRANQWNGVTLAELNSGGVEPDSTSTIQNTELPPHYERISCPFCRSVRAEKCWDAADIVSCTDCGTVYLRTRLKKEAMELLYQSYADGDSHMKIPETDEQINTSGLRRNYFLTEILEFVSPHGTLLDVGCGWAGFLNNARSKGFTPRGIELTRKGVAFANKYLGIHVTSDQFIDTPFDPESLAVVTMLHVLEHLPEPYQALKKVFEILEPGGMYCGIVPNYGSFCSKNDGEKWYWLDPDYHYVHYTPETLRRHLEAAGFVIERYYTASGDYGTAPIRIIAVNMGMSFAYEGAFNEWLEGIESEGQGEELRFFARKPF